MFTELFITSLSLLLLCHSNSITPRRKLSLEMDENAQSPLSLEQDFGKLIILSESIIPSIVHPMFVIPNNAHLCVGYCGSLGSSSATSLDENSDTSSANQSAR